MPLVSFKPSGTPFSAPSPCDADSAAIGSKELGALSTAYQELSAAIDRLLMAQEARLQPTLLKLESAIANVDADPAALLLANRDLAQVFRKLAGLHETCAEKYRAVVDASQNAKDFVNGLDMELLAANSEQEAKSHDVGARTYKGIIGAKLHEHHKLVRILEGARQNTESLRSEAGKIRFTASVFDLNSADCVIRIPNLQQET